MIQSLDSTSKRSSSGSLSSKYLLNLPNEYVISTSIKLTDESLPETHFGLLFLSASLEYNFAVYSNGWVLFSEYDYNQDSVQTLVSKHIELNTKDYIQLQASINDRDCTLHVNNDTIGSIRLKNTPRHWYDLRLYTSTQSTIMVDYIRIQ